MTPEQIQRLREFQAKATKAHYLDYELSEWLEIAKALPELLDDWERMWAENQRLKETLAGFVESYTNDSRFDDP